MAERKERETMYYYVQAFCAPYLRFMPVQYEKKDGEWHKVGMACDNITECKVPLEECKHFKLAPEIVTVDQLRETKL